MKQSNTARADIIPFQRNFEESAAPSSNDTPPAPAHAINCMSYVAKAIPVKGATPDEKGDCLFLLETYPVGNKMASLFHQETVAKSQAVYVPFYGHESTRKGDTGLVVGYIYNLKSDPARRADTEFEAINRQPVVTQADFVAVRPPHREYDTQSPEFGGFTPYVQNWDERIATNEKIKATRFPRREQSYKRTLCI